MLIYQMLKVRDNIRMSMYQHRKDRLLALIDTEYGGERVRFCDRTGLSESRLAQLLSKTYRNGEAFTEKTARKVELLAGLPPMYFDQQPTDPVEAALELVPGAKRVRAVEPGGAGMTPIRKVKLRVQAGITGFEVEPEYFDGETQDVPTDWLMREGLYQESLISIVVKGESMEPGLYQGDMIVVNTADTQKVSGAVYVVNYEGEAVVKRLMRDAGEWWLASDNPDQRKYHKQLCKGAICIIIGKVVRKESTHI